MHTSQTPTHTTIANLVLNGIREILTQNDRPVPADLDEATQLVGRAAILDSLTLVTLIVDLEQKIEEDYAIVLTIADDRAMSQQHSPFLTVRSLADYICKLIVEEQEHG